jgi:hypothetical protein
MEVDPGNRAAWATLANFAYRDPKVHAQGLPSPHREYRDILRVAIKDELRRIEPSPTHVEVFGPPTDLATLFARRWVRLGPDAKKVWPSRLKQDALLVRLVQAESAASANLRAALVGIPAESADRDAAHLWSLRSYLHTRQSERHAPPFEKASRRQLLLIEAFRGESAKWKPGTEVERPPLLKRRIFAAERRAWDDTARAGATTLEQRILCENAALGAWGDFAHDPVVAYTLACYRAEYWWRPYDNLKEASS